MTAPIFIKFKTSLVNVEAEDKEIVALDDLYKHYDIMGVSTPQEEIDAIKDSKEYKAEYIDSFLIIDVVDILYINPTDDDNNGRFIYTHIRYKNGEDVTIDEPIEEVIKKIKLAGVTIHGC